MPDARRPQTTSGREIPDRTQALGSRKSRLRTLGEKHDGTLNASCGHASTLRLANADTHLMPLVPRNTMALRPINIGCVFAW